ncbi:hypothetical protein NONO_c02610 [Nocardia nova SH22a]|uniref:Uncharacterized protein n=1 Tax=Nocardia nova SH22a TaxID=1415166 RepID=W5TCW8_9NOCA|nr:hypothetical protein [Nocardia nova]AHH15076.1 hypothetical protein NONO_c02610 [Nocardia nova SH22a]
MGAEETSKWQNFAGQARSGDLYLNDEAAARECLAACDARLLDLENLRNTVALTKRVSGFGDFDMGRALEEVFKKQAAGEPNSIDEVIKDNIEIVKNMREVMAQSIKILTGQDVDNTGQINSTDPAGR